VSALPRPAIYLAKFLALLPWSLGLNLGGFALLCLAAGPPGGMAFRLYWPAVLWATLAFSSLFYLMGAFFRRPAVVAIVYAFFLEVIFGNMPGFLKRISIGFYTRCMMYEAAAGYGILPEKLETAELPAGNALVEGATFLAILAGTIAGGIAVAAAESAHMVVGVILAVVRLWAIPMLQSRGSDAGFGGAATLGALQTQQALTPRPATTSLVAPALQPTLSPTSASTPTPGITTLPTVVLAPAPTAAPTAQPTAQPTAASAAQPNRLPGSATSATGTVVPSLSGTPYPLPTAPPWWCLVSGRRIRPAMEVTPLVPELQPALLRLVRIVLLGKFGCHGSS